MLSLRLTSTSAEFLFMILFFLFSDHNVYILLMSILPPSCHYFKASVITAVNAIIENNCLIRIDLLISIANYLILLSTTKAEFPSRVKQALVATLLWAPSYNTHCNPHHARCRKRICGSTCGHPFFYPMQ